jgi:putative ABC transport system permease protein
VGTEFKIVPNDVYYVPTEAGSYLPGNDYQAMFDSADSITVRIAGVVRQKEEVTMGLLLPGIAYSDELSELVIDSAKDSAIVKAQENSDRNVITMEELTEDTKDVFLSYLGGNATPYVIMVYPDNFEDKDAVTAYLDQYNTGKDSKDQIVYTDLAATMSSLTSGIMDGITIVLVAFAAISLVVSLIMISIITYTSVLERTKEIGILRALGARKKDITRVFDAETTILGIFSGLLGVVLAWALTFPINAILFNITELEGVASLKIEHAVFLVAISTILTVLGGHIPAKMASRKNAIEALRSE